MIMVFYKMQEGENHRSLPTAGVHSDENEAWDHSTQMHGQSVTNSTVVGSLTPQCKTRRKELRCT